MLAGSYTNTPVTISGTAETVAVTSPAATPYGASATLMGGPYMGLSVRGNINATLGTAATSVVWRVRDGSGTAGTVVGSPGTVTTVAVTTVDVPFYVIDTGGLPQTQYSVTLFCGAATSNGVINSAQIETDIVP